MSLPKLVHSPSQVIGNIANFETHAPELIDRISNARAWYATKLNGKWRFGHSKFIGYDGLSAKSYIKLSQELDGRVTEKRLSEWFVVLDPNTSLYREVRSALDEFLGRFGKTPNSLMRIAVLKDDVEAEVEAPPADNLVKLLAAVYRQLDQQKRAEFKKLIA